MKTIYIYKLIDPLTKELRYVGKTTNTIRRYKEHLRKSKDRKTYVNIWINDLLNDNRKPIMEIVDSCSDCNWAELEKGWITKLGSENSKITNLTYIGNKEDRNPILSVNTTGTSKRSKIFEEIDWLKNNTDLSSNDIIKIYGKGDWNRYKSFKKSKTRESMSKTKKYASLFNLHDEVKKKDLSELELFIWYRILNMDKKIPQYKQYLPKIMKLISKNGEFYNKLFYLENITSDYIAGVVREISIKINSDGID
jgi:hypothetical protein